ncbi:unnamed protein product [Strongylus vulgaris]|uniref:Uncharacterized protein n=1 Tax=Strongylus vulgaris TaxID=40348 RepID=A0A3P7LHA9_STRVU|nr:unnamed protein product [Strongylus vulgaris]
MVADWNVSDLIVALSYPYPSPLVRGWLCPTDRQACVRAASGRRPSFYWVLHEIIQWGISAGLFTPEEQPDAEIDRQDMPQ